MDEVRPCGCSGFYKCLEAVRLWGAANAAYRAYSDEVIQSRCVGPVAEALWKVYEAARDEYDKHETGGDVDSAC